MFFPRYFYHLTQKHITGIFVKVEYVEICAGKESEIMYLGKAKQNGTKIPLFPISIMICTLHWVNRCQGVVSAGKLIRVNTSSMFITHLSPSYCHKRPTGCSTEASKNNLSMQWSNGLSSPRCLADWCFNIKLSSNTDLKVSTYSLMPWLYDGSVAEPGLFWLVSSM